MSVEPLDENRKLEDYRAYLHLLANLQLDQALRAKIDVSGVVQQTMWEAYQALPNRREVEASGQLAPWLRQILANNLADELRKLKTAKRDLRRERSLEAALEQSSYRLGAWLAASQSTPSGQAQRQEQALQLSAALSKLPDAQREALILRHLQGRSLAEIADQLGRTPSAVAGLLKRGLQQLRHQLQGWQ